jgi:hypothetical protein
MQVGPAAMSSSMCVGNKSQQGSLCLRLPIEAETLLKLSFRNQVTHSSLYKTHTGKEGIPNHRDCSAIIFVVGEQVTQLPLNDVDELLVFHCVTLVYEDDQIGNACLQATFVLPVDYCLTLMLRVVKI